MNNRILLFLLIASTGWAQQPIFLNYSPAGFTDILVTPENDMIAVGRNFAGDKIELWKISSNGVEIWHRIIPFSASIIMNKLNVTKDKNYILSGNYVQAPGATKLAFIKFSPEGDIIWASYPEISKSVKVEDVFQLADQSYVMTGTSGSGSGKPYYSLFHFDSTASVLLDFSEHLVEGDSSLLNAQSPVESYIDNDNEQIIAICADNASGSNINSDSYVLKFSTSGQLVWKTKIDYGQSDRALSVTPLKDGSIVVCGLTNEVFSNPSARAFVTKLNKDGDVLWENFYDSTGIGAPVAGVDLLELKNGDLLISGYKIGAPKYNIFLLLADSAGNEKNRMVLWRNNHDDYPAAMVKLENNIIAIAGNQGLPLYRNLLVLFPLSIITDTKDLFIDSPLFEVYPNPVETQLTLFYQQIESSSLRLEIFSNSGENVFSGRPHANMDLSLYSAGMYYFILSDSKSSKSYVRKVIKGQ